MAEEANPPQSDKCASDGRLHQLCSALPEPPHGRRWHRASEFTAADLVGGYRPLLIGEIKCRDDETNWLYDQWCKMPGPRPEAVTDEMPAYRTLRPLPNVLDQATASHQPTSRDK